MSKKKREAFLLLEQMPDDKIDFVIEFIRRMEIGTNSVEKITPKMQAFQRLETLRKQTLSCSDINYDRELAEAREEKYGYFAGH